MVLKSQFHLAPSQIQLAKRKYSISLELMYFNRFNAERAMTAQMVRRTSTFISLLIYCFYVKIIKICYFSKKMLFTTYNLIEITKKNVMYVPKYFAYFARYRQRALLKYVECKSELKTVINLFVYSYLSLRKTAGTLHRNFANIQSLWRGINKILINFLLRHLFTCSPTIFLIVWVIVFFSPSV